MKPQLSWGLALPALFLSSTLMAGPDPWRVARDLPTSPAAPLLQEGDSCVSASQSLDLAGVVRLALCRNPDTRISWLQAWAQAQRVGVAKAAYLPTLNATAGLSQNFGDGGNRESLSVGANLNWLLYDFGGRESSIRASELTLAALQSNHDGSLQTVFKNAVDAYYQWFSATAALKAAQEAESTASETLRASESRFKVGTGTREDVLQAQTAQAQARLTTIQREGEKENALGAVAVVLGLAANSPLSLSAPPLQEPTAVAPPDWTQVLGRADEKRPDLRAQRLRVQLAEANRDNAAASGRPSLSFSARETLSRSEGENTDSGSVGLNLTVPLFSGFSTTYQVRAADKQIEIEQASYERLRQSASLELWQAWQGVRTAAATVTAADTVVNSAQESLRAARARYGVGLGDLINVLNAQSTLANAAQQQARARYDWYRARIALARAAGELGWADLAVSAEGNAL